MGQHKRYSVVDLKENHPEKFGRFIMALKNLINSDDWPRICGIHGNTFKPNDTGVRCPTDTATVTKIGETGEPFYCKHAVYSFIAWHAPYVYQFELLLNKYNTSKNLDYITLPWLDLTDFSVDFTFLNDPEITVFFDKKQVTTENPLAGAYYYSNGMRTRTTRGGFLSPSTKKQRSKLTVVKKQLNNALYAPNYEQFSSMPTTKTPSNVVVDYVPLETPHNSLHDIIGGDSGTMSYVNIAAFDPIFWLHHCNMDRHYYTWMHTNTTQFTKPIYPAKMTDESYNSSCAPFFKDYIYSATPSDYNWGWLNGTGKFMHISDVLQINRFPYRYDIIKPTPKTALKAFIELIDIPIPRESIEFNVYLVKGNTPLDKVAHYAGSAAWFGINRDLLPCCRCNKNCTNLKIDIEEFVAENGITASNINDYKVVIEGSGRLIKDETNSYKVYSANDLLQDGSYKIIIK